MRVNSNELQNQYFESINKNPSENGEFDVYSQNLFNLEENLRICLREGIVGGFHWFRCTFNCFWYEVDSSFTYPKLDSLSEHRLMPLLKIFDRENTPLESFSKEPGLQGYNYRIFIQEGVSLWFYGSCNKNGAPSTLLDITGIACERLIQNGKFIEVIKYCLKNGYNFTRFDSFVDVFKKDLMPLDYLSVLITNGWFSSKIGTKFDVRGTLNNESSTGYDGVTYYLGKNPLLRIYAKNWEQGKQDIIDTWVRWELEIKDHERIKQLLLLLVIGYEKNNYTDYFNLIAGVFKEMICFKLPGLDSNKSRWKMDPKWDEFLNGVKSIQLFAAPKSKSQFEISEAWFRKSCSLFLTQICIIYGEDKFFRYIKSLIVDKYSEMAENDYNLVINELNKQKKILNRTNIQLMINKFLDEINIFEFSKSVKITEEAIKYTDKLERIERDE